MKELIVVGGGLAGCEAAWQAAEAGVQVRLYEMRPQVSTGAHKTEQLSELVCSNSLGSTRIDRGSGLLKEELRQLGSMLLECAEAASLPAGSALAVDRDGFAAAVTARILAHPNIQLIRQEVTVLPSQPAIIASGPLTSPALTRSIQALTGEAHLFFYDAIAPIVTLESINLDVAFRASRYNSGETEEGDYINCPLNKEQYYAFIDDLIHAERITLKEFEQDIQIGVSAGAGEYFEGCLPVEVLAARNREALAYGPMRPVGLRRISGLRGLYAVVQLRQDNQAGTLYNLVGFQTNLTIPEQNRLLRTVPGLENAEFVRYGQMHRNTFISSPRLLKPSLNLIEYPDLFFAGQITGVEGYLGNIATGLLAGRNAARFLAGRPVYQLPPETMLGALCHYITHADLNLFQPMKANFGIMPPLEKEYKSKGERFTAYAKRALASLAAWARSNQVRLNSPLPEDA